METIHEPPHAELAAQGAGLKLTLALAILASLIAGLFTTSRGARLRSARSIVAGILVAVAAFAAALLFPLFT